MSKKKHKILFSLNLKKRPYQVMVAGSFNHWSCVSHPLRLSPSGAWETMIPLAPGLYKYRFLIDNSVWMLDPSADTIFNEFGGTESLLVVEPEELKSVQENKFVEQLEQYA